MNKIRQRLKSIWNILKRLSVRMWRSDLEVARRVIGLLNKVQLCTYGCLTKEHCIAVYLFTRWFLRLRRSGGWLNLMPPSI